MLDLITDGLKRFVEQLEGGSVPRGPATRRELNELHRKVASAIRAAPAPKKRHRSPAFDSDEDSDASPARKRPARGTSASKGENGNVAEAANEGLPSESEDEDDGDGDYVDKPSRPAYFSRKYCNSFDGRRVAKYFDDVLYFGVVQYWIEPDETEDGYDLWNVFYDDGDKEDYNHDDLMTALRVFRENEDEDPQG